MDITLGDVELAIKVLNEFMRRSREAQMVIKRLEITTVSSQKMPSSLQDFMNLAWQAKKGKREETETETPVEPITDEELAEFRKIADNLKKKPQSP